MPSASVGAGVAPGCMPDDRAALFVFEPVAFGASGRQGQARVDAVQRLKGHFLIQTENHRVLRPSPGSGRNDVHGFRLEARMSIAYSGRPDAAASRQPPRALPRTSGYSA